MKEDNLVTVLCTNLRNGDLLCTFDVSRRLLNNAREWKRFKAETAERLKKRPESIVFSLVAYDPNDITRKQTERP